MRSGPEDHRGQSGKKPTPERTCIVQRVTKHPNEMIRFVLDPDNAVTPDIKGTLPGRGVWVTATKADIDIAVEKRLFSREFKTNAQTASDLATRVDQLIEQSTLRSLSLTAKAGLVTTGFAKVMAALDKRSAVALLFAQDGADDGIRKVRQKLKALGQVDRVSVHQSLHSEQMALALGRVNVIHAALRDGGAAKLCLATLRKLELYRGLTAMDERADLRDGL
ncbi:MAG: RNA-binding protein [Pseudomonadota bacterium]